MRALLEWKGVQENFKGRRILCPGGIAVAASQFIFAGYSGAPFSNRAFIPHDGATALPVKLRARNRKQAVKDGKAIVRGLEQGLAQMSPEELLKTKEHGAAWLKTYDPNFGEFRNFLRFLESE